MKNPRFIFWIIIIFTILAVLINMPAFNIAKFPLLNKSINFPGFGVHVNTPSLQINRDFPFVRGLDLQGGTSITLRADMKKISVSNRQDALEAAKEVIARRVNLFGVKEPVVQTETVNGDSRIVVELPGVNVEEAMQLVGKTAQLTFWELATSSGQITYKNVPIGLYGKSVKETNLSGGDLSDSSVTFDPNTGTPQVQIIFTSNGTKKFADITTRNVGKQVAMVLDGVILEAPVVNQAILNGDAVITGNFTTDQANQLSIQLKAGALPIPLSVLQEQTIGATLGENALAKSLFAGILGFLVIVIFMSVLYKKLGLIASFALFLYTLFVLAVFKIIPVTLTLAGIAGFILSIGMAVDANILIFERIKEEKVIRGSMTHAIEYGFSRAWPSIRDSNVSTLITSFILYEFGTGTVKGFALTLAIGVLVSMFSAIVITRTFLRYFYEYN